MALHALTTRISERLDLTAVDIWPFTYAFIYFTYFNISITVSVLVVSNMYVLFRQ